MSGTDQLSEPFEVTAWQNGAGATANRDLPGEAAVAIVHDATTTAVLMASPNDLADLGRGFSLTEGIIDSVRDLRSLEVVESPLGYEVRMWLDHGRGERLASRRRLMTGPTGCGLCGIESLQQAIQPAARVTTELMMTAADIQLALSSLRSGQTLNAKTRAVHAAGYWSPQAGLVCGREDVGRHNALDKVVGALMTAPIPPGAVVLTSRVSVEMVQKSARLGAPIIIAVSAPTALSVKLAAAAGITVVAIARDDGFEVFSHAHRIGRD